MGKVKDSERSGILECELEYYADYGIGQMRTVCHELLHRREEARKTCKWRPMMSDVYETECENTFMLNEGTLRENNMTFCPFCGYKIEEVRS